MACNLVVNIYCPMWSVECQRTLHHSWFGCVNEHFLFCVACRMSMKMAHHSWPTMWQYQRTLLIIPGWQCGN